MMWQLDYITYIISWTSLEHIAYYAEVSFFRRSSNDYGWSNEL